MGKYEMVDTDTFDTFMIKPRTYLLFRSKAIARGCFPYEYSMRCWPFGDNKPTPTKPPRRIFTAV